MNAPLELEQITAMSLSITGVLVENYLQEGYADPTMYRALRAACELAEQYKERLALNGLPEQLLEAIEELVDNLKVTAMECGEIVQKIIEDNGWQEDVKGWDRPHNHDNCNHSEDGEDN
jgi:hypothetical protein